MAKGKKAQIGEFVGLIAGIAIANKVSNMEMSFIPEKMQKFKPAIPLVAGYFLAKKGKPVLRAVGLGMVGGGGVKLIGIMAPQLGIGTDEMIYLNGADDFERIEGRNDYALSGVNKGNRSDYALAGTNDSDKSNWG